MPLDPVCGMTVDEKEAAETSKLNRTNFYFCGESCKIKFDAHPEKYGQ